MLERYLDELDRRARRALAVKGADELMVDAREHLDASIQARLELGDEPETAERNAIWAFGKPKEVVGRMAAIHRARFHPFFLGCTTASALAAAFAALASPVLGSRPVTVTWFVFSVMFGCLVKSSEARRPWIPVLVSVAVFWSAFTAICAAWLRDFTLEGWASPRQSGPVDLVHAALWAAGASSVFLGYLVLAYRMARPGAPRRRHG